MEKNGKNMLSLSNPFDKIRSRSLTNELLKIIPEDIFINQKKKIQELKYSSEKSSTAQLKEFKLDYNTDDIDDSLRNEKIILTFNENYKWDQARFELDYTEGEEIPIISSDWDALINKERETPRYNQGIELRNMIIKSQNKINYQAWGAEVNAVVTLKGESSLWIFSRSPEVYTSNKNNSNNQPNLFNKHTSVIKIWKEDKCQRCFISFGIFVENDTENFKENGNEIELNRNIQFKTFSKRQLVNFSIDKNKNRFYYENDICELKIYLLDTAEERITVKIKINESSQDNTISGSFFLPIDQRSSIMLSGTGQSCLLKSLICKPFVKSFPFAITNETRNCECCIII